MLRDLVTLCLSLGLVACASGSPEPSPVKNATLSASQLQQDIDVYTTFAVAKYAGLTEEPHLSAAQYKRLLADVRTEPWIAEQAVFSVLRLGDMQSAIELAELIEPQTLAETELPRLTLAVAALKAGDDIATLTHLGTTWQSGFHAMLARSLAAWAALDADPDAAISIQAKAGLGEGIYTLMSQTLAAIMKASIGREDDALTDLEILWSFQARLALGVETQSRLLALRGDTDRALNYLDLFHQEVGRHPGLRALRSEIESGEIAAFEPLTEQEGAARVLYLATAPQAGAAYGDIAAVYFTLANYLDPDYHAIQALWANTLDNADRRDEAISLLQSIPEDSVHHTSAQGQLAWALRREGRNQAALLIARETLDRTNDRNIRVQLADLLQSLERDGEAEDIFTDIIEADETAGAYDWRIYFARGGARERLGVWPLAESDLKTALSLNPDSASIMNYLGYSWVDRGINLDDGLALIRDALALEPQSGAITDSLGWAHYKLGNFDEAILHLERATELAPDTAEILDHLGDAYWQVGRFKEAGYQWQRALLFSTDTDERQRLEVKLRDGISIHSAARSDANTNFP